LDVKKAKASKKVKKIRGVWETGSTKASRAGPQKKRQLVKVIKMGLEEVEEGLQKAQQVTSDCKTLEKGDQQDRKKRLQPIGVLPEIVQSR